MKFENTALKFSKTLSQVLAIEVINDVSNALSKCQYINRAMCFDNMRCMLSKEIGKPTAQMRATRSRTR